MHEMSIATELLEQVLHVAKNHDAKIIESVDVSCGEQRMVVLEALHIAWEAVTEGTLAAGATLTLTEQAMAATCRLCFERFRPAIDDYRCPRCGEADVDIVEGNDIILQSVVCHAAEQSAGQDEGSGGEDSTHA